MVRIYNIVGNNYLLKQIIKLLIISSSSSKNSTAQMLKRNYALWLWIYPLALCWSPVETEQLTITYQGMPPPALPQYTVKFRLLSQAYSAFHQQLQFLGPWEACLRGAIHGQGAHSHSAITSSSHSYDHMERAGGGGCDCLITEETFADSQRALLNMIALV